MNLYQMGLVLAAAAILLPLGIRGLVWRHVRERRLRIPAVRVVEADSLPPSLDPIFEAAERVLLPIGFEPLGARWIESIDASEGPRPERAYGHRESGALAFVGPPLPGMGERPYRVGFFSLLRDGSVISTADGLAHLTPAPPAHWICFDHDVNDLGRQWALHLHALDPRGGLDAARPLSLDDWNRIEAETLRATLAEWEEVGLTRVATPSRDPEGTPRWRFRLRSSWSLATRFLQGQRRVLAAEAEAAKARARQQLWRNSLEPVTDTLEPELDPARAAAMAWGYRYDQGAQEARRTLRSGRSRFWVGVASGTVCVALFGWWVGWQLAWILIGVLAIHELGHLAAMEAFGYRDRRILFIPFVGAATLGEKEDATPTQRALVYMLGPAPGVLLGLAALYAFLTGGDVWWLAAATTALLVNYLNLLPISPLDGGRIVETLLLGRFPRAQVVFIGIGAIAFAAGGWILRDPILAGIALALVISLRTAWIAAGALVRARERLDERATETHHVDAVFEMLQEAPYAGRPAAQRVRLAQIVIPRLGHRPASLRTALVGGLVYLTMLVGVPLAVTGSMVAFAPHLVESVKPDVVQVRPTQPPDREESAPQPSSSSISEASLVGR